MVKNSKTRTLVLHALFAALILLLGLTPLGLIPLGFINVTILCVPVVIGTLYFGLKSGLLFGACMAAASIMSLFGLAMTPPSTLGANLLFANPVYAILMSLIPRLLIPVSTHFAYRLFTRKKTESEAAIIPAAIAGSLTNTIFYLGLMLLFYTLCGLDSKAILTLIGGVGLIAGSLEAAAAALIATPVLLALRKLEK